MSYLTPSPNRFTIGDKEVNVHAASYPFDAVVDPSYSDISCVDQMYLYYKEKIGNIQAINADLNSVHLGSVGNIVACERDIETRAFTFVIDCAGHEVKIKYNEPFGQHDPQGWRLLKYRFYSPPVWYDEPPPPLKGLNIDITGKEVVVGDFVAFSTNSLFTIYKVTDIDCIGRVTFNLIENFGNLGFASEFTIVDPTQFLLMRSDIHVDLVMKKILKDK